MLGLAALGGALGGSSQMLWQMFFGDLHLGAKGVVDLQLEGFERTAPRRPAPRPGGLGHSELLHAVGLLRERSSSYRS